jgi:hypothetical protein
MGTIQRVCVLLVALWLCITPLAGLIAPTRAQDDDGGVPLPVAGFGEHPRLLITRTYIEDTLKPRITNAASTWETFAGYVDSGDPEEDAEWTPGTVLRSLALAWLVTGQESYAQRARAVMVDLANQVAADPVMNGEDGLDGAFFENVAALAVGYDWLYDRLTGDDRAELEDTLWRAAKRLRDPTADTDGIIWLDGQMMAFGNYEPRWLWALTAVGLALWGEHPNANDLIDYCRDVLTQTVIPALDLQTGGAWAEGPVYGFIAIWAKVQTALAWWTVLGENYFDDTRWWYDRLAYDMFLYHPAPTHTFNQDWGDPMPDYPSIIGDSERYHAAFALGRAQDALLGTVFAGTDHADWMAWYLRQGVMPGWMAVDDFLWRDPAWGGFPPQETSWFAPYNGHVFMRSNWVDATGVSDPNATYVSFNAGDRLAYHQFYDQGNFTIFSGGHDLVVRSGVYSGDGTSDHDANYYVRTIAGNTILVCDLAENFDGIRPNGERDVWLNDCGQRTMSPASRTAINVDYLLENWQVYDTGSITRFGEVGDATYIRADITGAYNSTVYTTPENRAKVSAVVRELVFWRPNLVIVSDRVITTYPSYTPMTVFHFQTEPVPSGLFFRSQVDTSVVYMQNLLPNSQITTVPGYQVAGQTVDKSWGDLVSNNFEDVPYGPYRLEITPGRPELDNWFLTTFITQDHMAAPPPENVLVTGQGLRGVLSGASQVMFDVDPADGLDVTEAAFPVGEGVTFTVVTGLRPNAEYVIEAEGSLTETQTATDAGLLVLHALSPGEVTLSVAGSGDQ